MSDEQIIANAEGEVYVQFEMSEDNWNLVTLPDGGSEGTVEEEDIGNFTMVYPSLEAYEDAIQRLEGQIKYTVVTDQFPRDPDDN